MRVLIVNAHAPSPQGQKAFQDLLACVKEVLQAYNGILEIKDEYIVRTKDNLEDFLYDEYTSFSQPGPGKQFDSLDLIVVSGDLHILPWHPSNYKVLTLLRMCIKVKKCLFAIGFAMQALVYLSASNLDYPINVLNGRGCGGKLGDIEKLNIPPDQIGHHDYFLDSVTGDLYYLQQETNEWAPLCNIGLHHTRTAQEFNTIGKFVIKTPIYRPKKYIHNSEKASIFDENVETKCYIKKLYLNHWLFRDCDMEFVVPYKGRWEVHSFNFTNKEKAFDILAESENGALVIEYQNIIGTKFLLSKRYKETYQMFMNFATKYADQIRCTGRSQIVSILSYTSLIKSQSSALRFLTKKPLEPGSAPMSQRPDTLARKTMQGLKHRVAETTTNNTEENEVVKVFKHSGMATKMKGKVILEHNFISSGKVRYDSPFLKDGGSKQSLDPLARKYSMPKKAHFEDEVSYMEAHRDPFMKYEHRSILKTSQGGRIHKRPDTKGSMHDQPYGTNRYDEDPTLTKADVRRWLYPDLSDLDGGFEKKNWIPGNMSQAKGEHAVSSKVIRIGPGGPDYRKKGSVPYLVFNEDGQKSLRSSDPYQTYNDIAKEHQKREDEKILGPRKFVLSKGPGMMQTATASPSSRFVSVNGSRNREW